MTQTENEVRERARDYVAGAPLGDFALWLAGVSWALGPADDGGLRDLVNSLDLRISEYSSGAWEEAELRGLIRSMLNASTVTVVSAQPIAPQSHRVQYADSSWTYRSRSKVA